jgi:dTDP-4-amino-4,6-dideoxygalactose transaminase
LARTLRDHGQCKRYFHDFIGYNYRMDGFQGAILRIKLKHLGEWTAKRRELAAIYRELLSGAGVELPQDDPQTECVYHLFVAYVENRDSVRQELEKRGVGTAIHYPRPVHCQQPYRALGYADGSLKAGEGWASRLVGSQSDGLKA